MNLYKYILALSAVLIAGSAAFFSVSGIAELFAASFWAVVIMAGALELGKLIAASFLHRYWKMCSGLLKTYLTSGVIVLMIITSMGIFGFLTDAYEQSASEFEQEETQIENVESKINLVEQELENYRNQREQLLNIRSRQTDRLNDITSNDSLNASEVGYLTRQTQDRIEEANIELDSVNTKISTFSDSLATLQNQVTEIKSSSTVRSELGPLLFVAREFNTDPDTAVKWFTFMIIFVFDPLAVSLVLAYNTIVMRENRENVSKNEKTKNKKQKEKKPVEPESSEGAFEKKNEKNSQMSVMQKNAGETNVKKRNIPSKNAKKEKDLDELKGKAKEKEDKRKRETLTIQELFEEDEQDKNVYGEEADDMKEESNGKNNEEVNTNEDQEDLKGAEKGEFKEGPVLRRPQDNNDNEEDGEEDLDEFVESHSGSSETEEDKDNSTSTKRVDFHSGKKDEK